jgi:hypothetical protein
MAPGPKPPVVGRPWGRCAGVLTGCLVTLIGVLYGVDPATILLRATIAALILGVLVGLMNYVSRRP